MSNHAANDMRSAMFVGAQMAKDGTRIHFSRDQDPALQRNAARERRAVRTATWPGWLSGQLQTARRRTSFPEFGAFFGHARFPGHEADSFWIRNGSCAPSPGNAAPRPTACSIRSAMCDIEQTTAEAVAKMQRRNPIMSSAGPVRTSARPCLGQSYQADCEKIA